MSTAKFNTWLNPDGTQNYKCRAWVNFNGTGTVAIRASGNVSSITDNGTGDYTVNFTTAMPDANYSAVSSTSRIFGTGATANDWNAVSGTNNFQTSSVKVFSYINGTSGQQLLDCSGLFAAVFR